MFEFWYTMGASAMVRNVGVDMNAFRWTLGCIALVLWTGCGDGKGVDGTMDATLDGREELFGEETTDEDGPAATPDILEESVGRLLCGDGVCDPGETCLSCRQDCACRCGDGVCTFGEYCVVCPEDCDCDDKAATPPMGWNTWNLFACDIHEDLIRESAQAMVDSGMAEVGYRFVNLDDCWQVDRTVEGIIVVDPLHFPSGKKALADFVHGLGLFLGTYTCAGTHTCQERPGSYGYEDLDMLTYAEWGVDYVKVDWCFTGAGPLDPPGEFRLDAPERFGIFRDAIQASGRDMLLSICNWGLQSPWVWGPDAGALWRTSGDIFDHVISLNINLEIVVPLAPFARRGHWNDPDMLEVGNGGMSHEEYVSHFSLWSILAAPLLAGNDIRQMDPDTRSILLNREVIAINQDPAGLQGVVVHESGTVRSFAKPLTFDGLRAVVMYNNHVSETAAGSVTWGQLGLMGNEATVRDLWAGEDLGVHRGGFEAQVPPMGSVTILVQGQEYLPGSGTPALGDMPWKYMANYDGPARRNRNALNGTMRMNQTTWASGIGVSGGARILYHLGGRCQEFTAVAGLDDKAGQQGSVVFQVWTDGILAWTSDTLRFGDDPVSVQVDLTGVRELELTLTPAGDSTTDDLANWADARVRCSGNAE
jgi:alpha-galactosidase